MPKRTHRSGVRSSRVQQAPLSPGDPDASAAGHRQQRLERILLEELQSLIRDEAVDPALEGVRLVSVDLSVDGGHARVGYVVVEVPLRAQRRVEGSSRDALARAVGFLRARLAALLDLKRLPKLSFAFVGVQEPSGAGPGGAPWHE